MGDVILTECFRGVVQTTRVRPRDSKARHLRAAICHMIAQGGSRVMLRGLDRGLGIPSHLRVELESNVGQRQLRGHAAGFKTRDPQQAAEREREGERWLQRNWHGSSGEGRGLDDPFGRSP